MLIKNKKKFWKVVWIVGILGVIYFVIVRPIRLVLIGMDGMAQQLPDTKNIMPEYRDLLDSVANSEIEANHTFNSQKRPSVSVETMYKNSYLLIFFKISPSYPHPLGESILLKKGHTNFSSKINYVSVIYGDVVSLFDFNFAISKVSNPQKVFLTFDGDSAKTIVRNDSLALFYLQMKKASIKYGLNSINDIVISTKENELKGDEVAMNLAFIRKHNSLYLIVMSPIHEEQPLSPDDLLKMLKQ